MNDSLNVLLTSLEAEEGVLNVSVVGSSVIPGILSPKDFDILVEVERGEKEKWDKMLVEKYLFTNFFNVCPYDSSYFTSYRKGKNNILLTEEKLFALLFRQASSLCKKLKLTKREDRVEVHKHILYGPSTPYEDKQ